MIVLRLTRGHDTSVKHISDRQAQNLVGREIVVELEERNPLHSHFCTMNISDRKMGISNTVISLLFLLPTSESHHSGG